MRYGQNDSLVRFEGEAVTRHGAVWLFEALQSRAFRTMLRTLCLTTSMGAGLVLQGATLADEASYARPRYLGAHVLYIGGGSGGRGYLMCRLTPQCGWSCDAWTASMYISCRNIVACY